MINIVLFLQICTKLELMFKAFSKELTNVNSWFARDVIAAMLVYRNKRFIISVYC
jgi:hypothetical protein